MSFADAEAALGAAIDADSGAPAPLPAPAPEQAPVAPTTPEGVPAPQQVQPTPTFNRDEQGRFAPRTPEEPTPVADTLFEGTPVNPDELIAQHPELAPLVKQLEGAFTRKTQALAEQRKQFEGLDPAVAREAVELYTALQDPQYLQQFHQELTSALQAQGLTPAQASAEAARQMDEATGQPGGSVSDQLAALKADPELAPVADAFSQLKAELDAMKAERQAEREAQELAQMQMALAGEIVRQESVLREQGFKEKDLDRIHELAAFHDGNLLQAAESYRAMQQELIADYLASKAAAPSGAGPVPGHVTPSEVPTQITTTEQGLAAALQHLAAAGIDTLE